MKEMDTLPIQVELCVMWAPAGPMIFNEHVEYSVDLEADRPAVNQYRWLRRFQRSVSLALRDVMTRHRGRQGPTVYLRARLGVEDKILDRFAIAVEHQTRKSGRFVRWYTKDDVFQEVRCHEPLQVVRVADRLLRAATGAWFARFLADEPGLAEHGYERIPEARAVVGARRRQEAGEARI